MADWNAFPIFGDKRSDKSLSDLVAQDAWANFPKEKQRSEFGPLDFLMKPVAAFGDNAIDWMLLGKKDEILAGMEAPVRSVIKGQGLGKSYDEVLTRLETESSRRKEENPVASTAGAVVGTVTGPGATVAGKFINKGGTMAARALRSVLPGTAMGAVAGAEGETAGERASGALWGAGSGALLAPVAQVGGELLGKFISSLFRGKVALPPVAQGKIDDPLQEAVQKGSATAPVSAADMDAGVKQLFKALEADGVDVQKLVQMAEAGQLDDRTIAGLAGPNTRQMIDTYASMNGPAKTIVAGAQRAGQQGQSVAITGATDRALGSSGNFEGFSGILESQKKASGPLYESWKAGAPVDVKPVADKIDDMLDRLPNGKVAAKLEEIKSLLIDRQGNLQSSRPILHEIKLAIDDIYKGVGKETSLGRNAAAKILEIQDELLGVLDKTGYSVPRDAFAGPAAVEDAAEIGINILKSNRIATAKDIAKMSASEKQGVIEGASLAVKEFVGSISDKADKAARLTNYAKYLDRIKAAFPSAQVFDQWKQSLFSTSSEFSAAQMAGKGSQTAPRAFDAMDQGIDTAATGVRAVMGDKSSLLQSGKELLRWLGAPNADVRTAAAAAGLGKIQDVLPYLSAINRPGPNVLGSALSGASVIPASNASAVFDLLNGAPR